MPKMTDDDLLRVLDSEAAAAFQYESGEPSHARYKALRDYLRFPYGTEQDGRSQVIASDVFDTVEGILPDLVEVFVSSDKAVVFDPVGPEDEKGAKQATDACNYVFYKANNGFVVLYSAAKDALLLRTGGVKWWWEVRRTANFTTYSGEEMQIAAYLAAHPDTEVVSREEVDEPDEIAQVREAVMQYEGQPIDQVPPQIMLLAQQLPPKRYTVRLKSITKKGKVCVEPIPPDELEVSANHNSILLDDCRYVCHKSLKSASDLREMGFDVTDDEVRAAKDETVSQDREFYDTIREVTPAPDQAEDSANIRGWVREEYVLVDYDGDGIAERRKIMRLGPKLLENVEFSHVPIAAWTPYLLTHKFDGLSVWDLVGDFQRARTDIWRNQLDNLDLANNQETVVLTDKQGNPLANIDDLLNRRPGGVMREQQPGAIRPYVERWQGIEAMPMMQYLDAAKERRTGYSPVVPGLDANALDKTATEILKAANERQKRMKLMARIMAEALMKPMFRGILKTLTDYCMDKLSFRLNNEYVQYDPQEWRDGYDMSVNVGIGTGDVMQQTQFLQGIAAAQAGIAQSPFGPILIDAEKIYNVHARLAELAGFKNPGEFWNKPKHVQLPDGTTGVEQPKSQPPLPLLVEQARQQAKAASQQQDNALDMQKHRAELAVQAANDQRDAEREQSRIMLQAHLEAMNQAAEQRDRERQRQFDGWREQLIQAVRIEVAQIAKQPVIDPATLAAPMVAASDIQGTTP